MNQFPTIDVIIPAYNPGSYLGDCLKKCFSQNCRIPYKVTLIDDGSTQDITPWIAPYRSKLQMIRLEKNTGAAHARNVGIESTSGELILFQDADDFMSEDRLSLTIAAFQKDPNLVMVCGNFRWVVEGKTTPLCFTSPPELYYATLLVHFPINMSTVGLKRSVLVETGIFDPAYPVAEDYDLWMRILKKYPDQVGYIPEEISIYNWCATQDSITKKYRHTSEYHKILAEISRKYNAI